MKKIIVIFLTLLTLTSCLNDFLDLKPISETYSANFWKSEASAQTVFTSIYADMQKNFNSSAGQGLGYIGWYEMRSDNFYGSLTQNAYPFGQININNINTTHPCADWNVWYKSIGSANTALYFIPTIPDLTDLERNKLLAEAYFLRAYCYFNIVRIWGDAPIVTKPVLTFADVTSPARDSSKLIMDSVIMKDIYKSMKLVDVNQTDMYRFNAGALYSLATDVAMWNHNYALADSCSNILINNTPYKARYTLVTAPVFYTVVSTATTSENIWTLKWSYANNSYNIIAQNLIGAVYVTKEVKDSIWATTAWSLDARRTQTIDIAYAYASNYLTSPNARATMWKYQPLTRFPNNTNEKYIPLYRLADIILLRAEALNKLGRYPEALTELNKIRTRAGLPSRLITAYSAAPDITYAIESDILLERRLELFGEGKRWFDLMRTGRAMATMNAYFEKYLKPGGVTNYKPFTDSWQLYWPVLQDNITENGNLKQTGQY
jgi:hypothetical protein